MKIAVLSGKGGTGKTFVSVNLACAADKAVYVDCDVEEPNGHLFLKPEITEKQSIAVTVPEADMSKCTGCRKCVDFCKYNALALLKDKLMIFYEVCHSCGGCILFCPAKALSKKQREIGTIEAGLSDSVTVLTGCLNTGEVSGVPIIKGLMPTAITYAQRLSRQLTEVRKNGTLDYLRPDGKTQVTVELDEYGNVYRIDTIVISAQHSSDVTQEQIRDDLICHARFHSNLRKAALYIAAIALRR